MEGQPTRGITISQALELINSMATVDLVAITYDYKRNMGGRRIALHQCQRTGSNHSTRENGTVTLKEEHRRTYPVTLHTALIESINGTPIL